VGRRVTGPAPADAGLSDTTEPTRLEADSVTVGASGGGGAGGDGVTLWGFFFRNWGLPMLDQTMARRVWDGGGVSPVNARRTKAEAGVGPSWPV
jgi:hypothetical protein